MPRTPLSSSIPKPNKRRTGKSTASQTPLNIRTAGLSVRDETKQHVRARLGRQLGKFAPHIERVTTRFEDINGPRRGVDKFCRIKVVLSHCQALS